MFRQVVIRKEDRSAQKLLWRGNDKTIEPETYEPCVMSIGAWCSPAIAQFIKNLNVLEHREIYLEAADYRITVLPPNITWTTTSIHSTSKK